MYKITFVLCLAVIFLVNATEQAALKMTDDDLCTNLAENETSLGLSSKQWCRLCETLNTEYANDVEIVVDNNPPITMDKVEFSELVKKNCNKLSASGSLTLTDDEEPQDYNGSSEANNIAK